MLSNSWTSSPNLKSILFSCFSYIYLLINDNWRVSDFVVHIGSFIRGGRFNIPTVLHHREQNGFIYRETILLSKEESTIMKLRKTEKIVANNRGLGIAHNADAMYQRLCYNGTDQATAQEKVKKIFPQWRPRWQQK